jgi:predicted  nucleic acid-binding Zn-ribbon protein
MKICENCGAEFAETLAGCPYCGHIDEQSASEEYMEDMKEISRDMGELSDASQKSYFGELSHQGKMIKRVLIIFLIAAAVLGGLIFALSRVIDSGDSSTELKARIAWERENFSKLDTWYAEEDYDSILNFCAQEEDKPEYGFYDWEHSDVLSVYLDYADAMLVKEELERGEGMTRYDLGGALSDCMYCCYFLEETRYTKEEWERVEAWQEELRAFLLGELGLTEEEADQLAKKANQKGYIDFEVFYDYAEKLLDRF